MFIKRKDVHTKQLPKELDNKDIITIAFVFQIIAFDELKTDYKNPIDQCNSLNPVRFTCKRLKSLNCKIGGHRVSVKSCVARFVGLWLRAGHWVDMMMYIK